MFKLSVNNYRCFKDASFDFSKVNILIGENSSGKSSILKFLLVLKQSFMRQEFSNLTLNEPLVDLGNYKETIYKHNQNNSLEFKFEFLTDYEAFVKHWMMPDEGKKGSPDTKRVREEIESSIGEAFSFSTSIHFKMTKQLDKHHTISTVIENSKIGRLEIKPIMSDEEKELRVTESYPKCDLKFKAKDGKEQIFTDVSFEKEAFLTKIVSHRFREKFSEKQDNMPTFYQMAFLLLAQNFLRQRVATLEYCNPILSIPERFFSQKDGRTKYSKNDLEMVVGVLTDAALKKADKDALIKELEKAMQYFGLAEEIILNKNKNLPVTELRVKIGGVSNNILDVGYGVALQIPIIFRSLLSSEIRNGELILIEQPEVHLHPRLQAKFIETLLKLAPNNVYVIETHSEYMLRKIQSLVKQKAFGLKPSDISVHYLKKGKGKTLISSHSIDEYGNLEPNLPPGFTDSSYTLAKELL